MKNMAFKVLDRLFIVVYGPLNPTDDEWYQYMEAVRRLGIERTLQLVVTEGGGPNSTQRKYLNDLLAGRTVPVAVLSSSATVRGITTALGWFNRGIKAFSPADVDVALRHLGLPEEQAGMVELQIGSLRRQISLPQVACG